MTGVTRVQTVSMGIDTAQNTTNRSKIFTSAIGAGNYMLVCFGSRNNDPGNFTVSDDKSNTWTAVAASVYDSSGGRGVMAYYALANAAAQAGAPTVTLNKNGGSCGCGGTMFELSTPAGTFLDVTPVTGQPTGTTVSVTLGSSVYDHSMVVGLGCTAQSAFVTATPLSGYTTADSVTNTSIALQVDTIYQDTTTAGVYSPGWTMSQSVLTQILGFIVRGTTTASPIAVSAYNGLPLSPYSLSDCRD